jgi:hypothetical protein
MVQVDWLRAGTRLQPDVDNNRYTGYGGGELFVPAAILFCAHYGLIQT